MKLSNKILAVLATGVISCGLMSQQAQAVPITGDIDFAGSAAFDTQSLATATTVVTWSNVLVFTTSGSFTSVAFGTPATFFNGYVFNPSSPKTPLWTVGGFTFNLLTSTILMQNANFLNVTGTGFITSTDPNLDQTPGLWSFTSSKSDGGMSAQFTFGANTAAVPEGGSALALLGVALVGVEVLRRKLASA